MLLQLCQAQGVQQTFFSSQPRLATFTPYFITLSCSGSWASELKLIFTPSSFAALAQVSFRSSLLG